MSSILIRVSACHQSRRCTRHVHIPLPGFRDMMGPPLLAFLLTVLKEEMTAAGGTGLGTLWFVKVRIMTSRVRIADRHKPSGEAVVTALLVLRVVTVVLPPCPSLARIGDDPSISPEQLQCVKIGPRIRRQKLRPLPPQPNQLSTPHNIPRYPLHPSLRCYRPQSRHTKRRGATPFHTKDARRLIICGR